MKYPMHNVHGVIQTNRARQGSPQALGTLVYDYYLRARELPSGRHWEVVVKMAGGGWREIGMIELGACGWTGTFEREYCLDGEYRGTTVAGILDEMGRAYRRRR